MIVIYAKKLLMVSLDCKGFSYRALRCRSRSLGFGHNGGNKSRRLLIRPTLFCLILPWMTHTSHIKLRLRNHDAVSHWRLTEHNRYAIVIAATVRESEQDAVAAHALERHLKPSKTAHSAAIRF